MHRGVLAAPGGLWSTRLTIRATVLRWGMSETLGPISFVAPQDGGLPPTFAPMGPREVTCAVQYSLVGVTFL